MLHPLGERPGKAHQQEIVSSGLFLEGPMGIIEILGFGEHSGMEETAGSTWKQ